MDEIKPRPTFNLVRQAVPLRLFFIATFRFISRSERARDIHNNTENRMNETFNMEFSSELHQSEMDDLIRKGYALNSILHELFEEKVSTQKNHHWILGPEDLNDTLVHDFEREEAA